MKHVKQQGGFTLLELLVTIAIIGILASVAYPVYIEHVTRTKRVEAQSALLQLATKLEHYYAVYHTYAGANLKNLHANEKSEHGYYHLTIKTENSHTYALTATPIDTQAIQDAECGTLTLNQAGEKGITGMGKASQCW